MAICGGRTHDFRLFRESGIYFRTATEALADKGFIGIQHIHVNSTVPKKSSKKNPLTKEERKQNAEISKRRIYIEHTNRMIKRFHILSTRYRNKRKRFGLRASLGFRTGLMYNLTRAGGHNRADHIPQNHIFKHQQRLFSQIITS